VYIIVIKEEMRGIILSIDDSTSQNFECALSEGFIYTPAMEDMVVIDFNDDGFAAVTQYLEKMENESTNVYDPLQAIDQETFMLFSDNSPMTFDQIMHHDPSFMADSPSILNTDLSLNVGVFTSQVSDVGSEFA
jgi:hypothetical protein